MVTREYNLVPIVTADHVLSSRRGRAAQHRELPQHWHARLEPRRVLSVVVLDAQPRLGGVRVRVRVRGRVSLRVRVGVRVKIGGALRALLEEELL